MRFLPLVLIFVLRLWLTAAFPLAARGAPDAPPSLAVVGGPGAEAEAALLSAECSRTGVFTLVERDEIAHALAERHLSQRGLAGAEPAGFGPWLGADGVLVLERAPAEKGAASRLRGRLVATRSGVVLWAIAEPVPLPEPGRWAADTARRLAGWAPKLAVRREQAVPVSLLGLHAALRGDGPLEEAMDDLLALRLSREPAVFVLERRRLEELGFEKALLGAEEPFWTGARVLEGTVTREGATIRVEALLRPPPGAGKSGEPHPYRAQGVTPLAVVEQLAAQVMSGLGPRGPGMPAAAWDPGAEADLFGQEAIWALRWNLPGRARRAAEAAWALGGRSATLGQVRALAGAIEGGGGDLNRFQPFPPEQPPPPRHLAALLGGFTAYAEPGSRPPAEDVTEGRSRRMDGEILLEMASRLLAAYAGHVGRIPEAEQGDLRELRGRVRELAFALLRETDDTPEMSQFGSNEGWSPLVPNLKVGTILNPTWIIADRAGLWLDGADDVARLYNALLDRVARMPDSEEGQLTGRLRGHHTLPSVVAWRREDAPSLQRAWGKFLDDASRAGPTRRRLYAHLMRLEPWLRGDTRGRHGRCPVGEVRELLGVLRESRAEMAAGRVSWRLMSHVLYTLEGAAHSPEGKLDPEFPGAFHAEVCRDLFAYFLDAKNGAGEKYAQLSFRASAYAPDQRAAILEQMERAKAAQPRFSSMLTGLQGNLRELTAKESTPTPPASTPTPPSVSAPAADPPTPLEGKVVAVLWAEGKLWVQTSFGYNGKEGGEMFAFTSVTLPDWKTGFFVRRAFPGNRSGTARFTTEGGRQNLPRFAVLDDRPYALGEPDTLWGSDPAGTAWLKWTVPGTRDGGLWAVGRFLYLSGEDGVLLRLDPRSGGAPELLASARRRPAQNVLEDTPVPFHVARVFDAGGDRLGVVLDDGRILVAPAGERPMRWTEAFNVQTFFEQDTFDRALLLRTVGAGGELPPPLRGFLTLLWQDPDGTGRSPARDKRTWPPRPDQLSGDPRATSLLAGAGDGDTLWALLRVPGGHALQHSRPGQPSAPPEPFTLPEGQAEPTRLCNTPFGPVCYSTDVQDALFLLPFLGVKSPPTAR